MRSKIYFSPLTVMVLTENETLITCSTYTFLIARVKRGRKEQNLITNLVVDLEKFSFQHYQLHYSTKWKYLSRNENFRVSFTSCYQTIYAA